MKRFTETSKWSDPWFYVLKPELKLLWLYIVDNCDCAGVWQVNLPMASHVLGYSYSSSSLEALGDRIEYLFGDKYWIPKFCAFQYGDLSDFCKQHINVKKRLLEINRLSRVVPTLDPTLAPSGKEKEKEKEKESSRGSAEGEAMEIYSLYPRKVARPAALKAILKALEKTSADFLKEKTSAYAKAINGTDPQFIPHPATWFNQERFNDPLECQVRHASPPTCETPYILKTKLDAKQTLMAELKNKHTFEDAMGTKWSDSKAKNQYLQLKSEVREINEKISRL